MKLPFQIESVVRVNSGIDQAASMTPSDPLACPVGKKVCGTIPNQYCCRVSDPCGGPENPCR